MSGLYEDLRPGPLVRFADVRDGTNCRQCGMTRLDCDGEPDEIGGTCCGVCEHPDGVA